MSNSINDVIQILQIAIAPTVLISGVGLLILSLNTRGSLILDRIRSMINEYSVNKKTYIKAEIDLLYKRAKIIRLSIFNLVMSIIINVLVIISIFFIKLLSIENGMIIPILFVVSIVFLFIGLIAFMHDINMNLKAMRIEMQNRMPVE
ncbi:MAG: DUF2721 domain-containing protein [Bacteroidales bacterium]|nr:DUF2721 domain-containing protein [Bacteroidales bacterium]